MLSRGMIAVAIVKSIESRVADRGFWLQTGRAVKAFSCGGTGEGAFGVGLVGKGRRRMTRSNGRARGIGKGLKRKMVEQRGGRTFIDVESGGWPVSAPCPMRRAPNPGGQTPHLRL
jgi:hypothetical protein